MLFITQYKSKGENHLVFAFYNAQNAQNAHNAQNAQNAQKK